MKIIVLGSSASAISFIDTYVKTDKESVIQIITKERIKPYFRPMLSHMLATNEIPTSFYMKKDSFYEENNIKINYQEEVLRIDSKNKMVITDKDVYSYDKLIIGLGSNNFVPPVKGANLDNVCNLKFYKDLENINEKLKNINHITIIGGGLLGIEASWALAKSGKKVSILEFSNKLMARQMDVAASDFIIKQLEKVGIEVKTNANVIEILGDSKVESYKLENGEEQKTDMILYSIGVRPNINILKDAEININKGVVVDENYMTSNPNIYALGDIAEYNSMVNGTWTAAMNSGKIAARHLLNIEPMSTSTLQLPIILKALDMDVASIGIIDEELGLQQDVTEEKYIRYFVKNDILVGAIVIGDKKMTIKLNSMLNKKL